MVTRYVFLIFYLYCFDIRGARYYRYTDKPRCGLEKIRIAIRFGRIGSLGNLR